MSKLSKAVKEMNKEKNLAKELRKDEVVTNFMNGDSYVINPLDTLKMISASSIFGEPSYYRSSGDRPFNMYSDIKKYLLFSEYENKTTNEIFTEAIDKALNYDFEETLKWAAELRNNYYMRLNPQVIITRAAIHPKRKEWSESHPGLFNKYNEDIMKRADDAMSQMSYYLYLNGSKSNIPSIIKRSWAKKLSSLSAYEINKYKNHEIGMINAVRISHANSDILNELMKNGSVNIPSEDKTWEQHRSAGKSWAWILENCELGHMALLRNVKNVFTEINNVDVCKAYLEELKSGVINGKQFPFRYWAALKKIISSDVYHKTIIMNSLEECMDIACANFPKLKGKTMCLSDNSSSAWGAFNSEYGSVTVAEIDNLSSVITAACSDEGYVGKFGNELKVFPITKRNGILSQTEKITNNNYSDVGGETEGGIWHFFKNAIDNKEHWDNIFIYSDMQAGHNRLYGSYQDERQYKARGYECNDYINVFKLILDYRKLVNPKVNVFCIQTAGYNDVLVPEYAYRANIMYGWTGKEASFAKAMIDLWDQIEKN